MEREVRIFLFSFHSSLLRVLGLPAERPCTNGVFLQLERDAPRVPNLIVPSYRRVLEFAIRALRPEVP